MSATLRLRDGRAEAFLLPTEGSSVFNDLRACLAGAPSPPHPIQFSAPDGKVLEVSAADIAAVEVDPPYCLIPDFLSDTELGYALDYALAHEHAFVDATVSLDEDKARYGGSDHRYRRSRILYDIAPVIPMVAEKLDRLLPQLWPRLGLKPVPMRRLEYQMTAHGDGDFFTSHTDNGLPDIAHRFISYVHYFHQEPKRFAGGHLRLYKTVFANGTNTPGALTVDIDPPRNALIVFPSHVDHEVTPIRCSSSALVDQRLTINGWFVP